MSGRALRVYLVDDEPLALSRLERMLAATGRALVAGSESDPEAAVAFLAANRVDALFLDIQMPGMSGFDLLARLADPPPVVFTTAYDEFALRAFEVYSVDYLLKPVEAGHLDRALAKLERLAGAAPQAELRETIERLAAAMRPAGRDHLDRVASRVGDRVRLVEVAEVTHFYARDKLTYAATAAKDLPVDLTIAQLEERLDPRRFLRVHRSALVNVDFVAEVVTAFPGRMVLRLKDARRTEVRVARDRARALRERLGF